MTLKTKRSMIACLSTDCRSRPHHHHHHHLVAPHSHYNGYSTYPTIPVVQSPLSIPGTEAITSEATSTVIHSLSIVCYSIFFVCTPIFSILLTMILSWMAGVLCSFEANSPTSSTLLHLLYWSFIPYHNLNYDFIFASLWRLSQSSSVAAVFVLAVFYITNQLYCLFVTHSLVHF